MINVQGRQVFAFGLQENGKYQQCNQFVALAGLPIALLEQILERLNGETNISAALWCAQQIAQLS